MALENTYTDMAAAIKLIRNNEPELAAYLADPQTTCTFFMPTAQVSISQRRRVAAGCSAISSQNDSLTAVPAVGASCCCTGTAKQHQMAWQVRRQSGAERHPHAQHPQLPRPAWKGADSRGSGQEAHQVSHTGRRNTVHVAGKVSTAAGSAQ